VEVDPQLIQHQIEVLFALDHGQIDVVGSYLSNVL
jgi:hypothetical protein